MYDYEENSWEPLPSMNESKAANSLCVLGHDWLYSFGGICKENIDSPVSDRMERLSLVSKDSQWEMINLLLPNPITDIG
jgi:hypothetical protein